VRRTALFPTSALTSLLGLLIAALPLAGQGAPDTARTARDSALRVFFDCQGFASGCDFDFMRTEITFVDYVRNREDAQVHVLVTTQGTGSGGTEYTLTLIGRGRFAGRVDTLRYLAGKTDTPDEQRRGVAHLLKLSLAAYAATTPLARDLAVIYSPPHRGGAAEQTRDPWDYWVFSTNVNGFFNGQKSTNSQSIFGSLSANRVTEAWKVLVGVNESYDRNSFDLPVYDSLGAQIGTTTEVSIARRYGGDALVVKSLGGHWSAGLQASANHSTFNNTDLAIGGGPAIEYDIYPYSESTRRILRINYQIAATHFRYLDTTIFDRTRETLLNEALSLSFNTNQPWGSASLSVTGSNFLYDFKKNRLELFGSMSLRVVRGLSFNFFSSVSLVHDQLFLPKQGASDTEILLQRRALETSYQYFGSIGLSYSFGSKLNNVVNPRFGRGSGGSIIMISN
jgi:hypothetical protein